MKTTRELAQEPLSLPNILCFSKEWCEKSAQTEGGSCVQAGNPAAMTEHAFSVWFDRLTELAKARGLLWLVGDREANRDSFTDGDTPEQHIDSLIADATSNA